MDQGVKNKLKSKLQGSEFRNLKKMHLGKGNKISIQNSVEKMNLLYSLPLKILSLYINTVGFQPNPFLIPGYSHSWHPMRMKYPNETLRINIYIW